MSGIAQLYHTITASHSREQLETKVKQYLQSFPKRDLDARQRLFAEDAFFADPANSPGFDGIANIRAFWEMIEASGAELTPEIHQLVVCGDSVMADFTMHMASPEETQSLHVREVFDFNPEGKIQTLTAWWDLGCLTRKPDT
ncbi:MAG: nuclear transport factor 2 family protein [Ketobacteraceae bacterium]|nr:nuclear transport factor 2 family protein [Ketobacteraceae bacterium]